MQSRSGRTCVARNSEKHCPSPELILPSPACCVVCSSTAGRHCPRCHLGTSEPGDTTWSIPTYVPPAEPSASHHLDSWAVRIVDHPTSRDYGRSRNQGAPLTTRYRS